MTNEEYLKGIKEADEKWFEDYNMDFNQIATADTYDAYRHTKALEIIAETLIKVNSKIDDMMTSDGRLKIVDIFHG